MSYSLTETFQERKKKKWDRLMKEHKKAQKEEKRGKKKNYNLNDKYNYSLKTISPHTQLCGYFTTMTLTSMKPAEGKDHHHHHHHHRRMLKKQPAAAMF